MLRDSMSRNLNIIFFLLPTQNPLLLLPNLPLLFLLLLQPLPLPLLHLPQNLLILLHQLLLHSHPLIPLHSLINFLILFCSPQSLHFFILYSLFNFPFFHPLPSKFILLLSTVFFIGFLQINNFLKFLKISLLGRIVRFSSTGFENAGINNSLKILQLRFLNLHRLTPQIFFNFKKILLFLNFLNFLLSTHLLSNSILHLGRFTLLFYIFPHLLSLQTFLSTYFI